ncbi:MAG: tetratricopeptide repeat protein [Nitrospirota bacterium]
MSTRINSQRIMRMIGPIVLGVALAFSPVACASSERAAQEAYELAQFEQKQGNVDHARELYRDIVAKYPNTSWADKARASLSELPPAQP